MSADTFDDLEHAEAELAATVRFILSTLDQALDLPAWERTSHLARQCQALAARLDGYCRPTCGALSDEPDANRERCDVDCGCPCHDR